MERDLPQTLALILVDPLLGNELETVVLGYPFARERHLGFVGGIEACCDQA